MNGLQECIAELVDQVGSLPLPERVAALNAVRVALHQVSPFQAEPVDCVVWVPAETVTANDYNPNSVAPPEMRLLELSILADGYTQPIVAWQHKPDDTLLDGYEVIDGFHRSRIGKESAEVRSRVHGYLPLAIALTGRLERTDRIAATIRHNRARGKHQISAMSDIVMELRRRNWSEDKIGRELGMDPDEVLRLAQITGLAEMFADSEFSKAWDIEELDTVNPEDFVLEEGEVDAADLSHLG